MKAARQPDLFGNPQSDLFGSEPPPPLEFRGDPDRVRARLEKIVAADTMPWDRATLRLYRTIIPQMTLWLDASEAASWRLEFDTQVRRLDAG